MNEEAKQALGARIRRIRIQQGLTQKTIASGTACSTTTLVSWEHGLHAPLPWKLPLLAQALGVPVAQLFTDDPVIAEIRVSQDTLARVRDEGRSASIAASERLASQLEPLIWQEATRPPVDVRPGARAARKRMSRREVLAGVKAADRAKRQARAIS